MRCATVTRFAETRQTAQLREEESGKPTGCSWENPDLETIAEGRAGRRMKRNRRARPIFIRRLRQGIVSMMQFNMYHHYTVDEHLAALRRLPAGQSNAAGQ